MRLLGHPVHVMLVHFPVALWPAHACLHLFASKLPAGAAAIVGFWILVAGTALGWLAALMGLADLVALSRQKSPAQLRPGLIHAAVNGGTLLGFTVILALEYAVFPAITHGRGFLLSEAGLLGAMLAGNHFGGSILWQHAKPS